MHYVKTRESVPVFLTFVNSLNAINVIMRSGVEEFNTPKTCRRDKTCDEK